MKYDMKGDGKTKWKLLFCPDLISDVVLEKEIMKM